MTTFQIICFIVLVILIMTVFYFCATCYNFTTKQFYSFDLQHTDSTGKAKNNGNQDTIIKELKETNDPLIQTALPRSDSSCSILIVDEDNSTVDGYSDRQHSIIDGHLQNSIGDVLEGKTDSVETRQESCGVNDLYDSEELTQIHQEEMEEDADLKGYYSSVEVKVRYCLKNHFKSTN